MFRFTSLAQDSTRILRNRRMFLVPSRTPMKSKEHSESAERNRSDQDGILRKN
jgi:hypothetical protein